MINYLVDIVGHAPVGFEFLEYVFNVGFCVGGVYALYSIIKIIFKGVFR